MMINMSRAISCIKHFLFTHHHYSLRCLSSRSITFGEQESSKDGNWLHKLDDVQKAFIYTTRHRCLINSGRFTLNSRKPLSAEVVQQAMVHLQRKAPVLQTVLRERQGNPWFYKLQHVDIDFLDLNIGVPEKEVLDESRRLEYDISRGPLWRVRMLPLADDAPCADPQVKKDYPHQYELYLLIHHSIADAIGVAMLFQPLINIVNQIIEGDEIDSSPVGVFVTNKEYEEAYIQIENSLLADPERLEKLKDFTVKANKSSILSKCFPHPEVTSPSTNDMYVNVDEISLSKFLAKCKNIGITGGTGLQMIANTALVELAQEAGSHDESYTISTNLPMDMRRYLKPRDLPILGSHAHTITSVITIEKDARRYFWKNCYDLYTINSDILKNKRVIEQTIGRKLFLEQVPLEDFYSKSVPITRDYTFNNMGSFNKIVNRRGKHVQITDFAAQVELNNYSYPFVFRIHEYRGRHRQMLSYTTKWLTEENAEVVADKIRSLVDYCSKH